MMNTDIEWSTDDLTADHSVTNGQPAAESTAVAVAVAVAVVAVAVAVAVVVVVVVESSSWRQVPESRGSSSQEGWVRFLIPFVFYTTRRQHPPPVSADQSSVCED